MALDNFIILTNALQFLGDEGPILPDNWTDGGTKSQAVSRNLGIFQYVSVFTIEVQDCSAAVSLPVTADPPFPPVWPYTWDTSLIYGRQNLGQNLRLTRGDTLKFDIAIVTSSGVAVDLSGSSLKLSAKWDVAD